MANDTGLIKMMSPSGINHEKQSSPFLFNLSTQHDVPAAPQQDSLSTCDIIGSCISGICDSNDVEKLRVKNSFPFVIAGSIATVRIHNSGNSP